MQTKPKEDNKEAAPTRTFAFNRLEFAGSLGDLGTVLPLVIALIIINGMNAVNVLILIGGFYIISGLYFKVTVPVQPMKIIAAYAIAMGLTPLQIASASLWMGIFTLILGVTGLIHLIGKYTPKSTVRGVQLAGGILLMIKGLQYIIQPDPNLAVQSVASINTGIIIGIIGIIFTFLFLENRTIPAAVIIVFGGILTGFLIGKPVKAEEVQAGFYLPDFMPYGIPTWSDLLLIIPLVVLPQIPMTIGNAVIAQVDTTKQLFGRRAGKMTYRSISNSQGIADILSFFWGGIPMCHGAGGAAAHYFFGARTGGANLMIGFIFVVLGLFFGKSATAFFNLLPAAVLGVLLFFAGSQLAIMVQDLKDKKEIFVALTMLGITLASNLAVAFICGIILAYALRSEKIKV